jgi:hypothetical protein
VTPTSERAAAAVRDVDENGGSVFCGVDERSEKTTMGYST